jgi:rRNA small subunit pseudouridine methyltransferase Nep1
MGRPYAVKGRKKKRKLDEAAATDAAPVTSDEAEELQSPPEEVKEEDVAATGEGEEHVVAEGLPVVPRTVGGKRRSGAIFVLERACLEVGKVGKVRLAEPQLRNFLSVSRDFVLPSADI